MKPAVLILSSALLAGCVTQNEQRRMRDFDAITVGMPEAEVIQRVGKPDSISKAPYGDFPVWKWNAGSKFWGGSWSCVMDDGKVFQVPGPWDQTREQISAREVAHTVEQVKRASKKLHEPERRWKEERRAELIMGRKDFVAAHPELTPERKAMILAGTIQVGMSRGEAQAARGKPDKINASGGIGGEREQWVYRSSDLEDSTYLYFVGGALTSWQFVK